MYSCVTYTCTVSSDLMDDVNVNSRPNLALVKDNCGPVHSGLATFLPGCFNHKTTCSKIMMGTTGFGFAGVFVCLFFFLFPTFLHLLFPLPTFIFFPSSVSPGSPAGVKQQRSEGQQTSLYTVCYSHLFFSYFPHCVIGPVFASF